jgi:predicted permease
MRLLRAFLLRVWGMFRTGRSEREFIEEIEAHLQMRTDDHIRAGMTPDAARRAAVLESGGLEPAREAYRDRRGLPWVAQFFQDCRYAVRAFRRSPGFTLTALLTLALGIGSNTAIFSLVDAFLLRTLPVRNPQELVVVRRSFPYPTFEQFRDRSHSFSGMFAYDESHVTVTIDGQPDYLDGDFVTGNYFDVLGVSAIAGRTFRADDDQPGRQAVAVISYRYWDRRFGRQASAIGKTVYLADTPCVIIGVTRPGFFGRRVAGNSADIVAPMFVQRGVALKDHDEVSIMARLNAGVSTEQARAELDVLYRQTLLERAARTQRTEVNRIELNPGIRGTSDGNGWFETELRILAGVTGITLLIACVNIANLLLARAAGRQREIAVRLSIGAGRGRLIRQLLTESALLAMAGGALGLLFAKAGVRVLLAVLSYGRSPVPFDLGLDLRVLSFAAAISILTGILFGLAPALAAARVDLIPMLKGSERGLESQHSRWRTGHVLVVAQVALSLVLLIGSGLMIRSLKALYDVDFGFERAHVAVAWVLPALAGYDHAREMNLYRELPEKLSAIPGVRSASLLRVRIVGGGGWYRRVWTQGPETIAEEGRKVRCDSVGPRFLATMGIALLSGREFSVADSETSARVAIVSEAMARKFFPNRNPLGLRLGFGGPASGGEVEIVGLARDIRHRVPEDRPAEGVYIPYTQSPGTELGQMNLMVRTAGSAAAVIASMRREVQAIDRNLPLVGARTQAEEIDGVFGSQRSLATLLSVFGMLALVLTSVGLYGTMSQAVGRRTKEIGIRAALGAERGDLLWMVLRQALWLIAAGVAIGVPMAAAGTQWIASMLFGVKAGDGVTMGVTVVGMIGTGVAAAYVPARRAMGIDVMRALREE